MKQRAVIAGVGASPFSKCAQASCLELALTAIDAALDQAGIERTSINGVLSYSLGDSVPAITVARSLGLPSLRWHNDIHGGGSQSVSLLWESSRVLEEGLADFVVLFRSVRSASGQRMGRIPLGSADGLEQQFLTPYGLRGPANLFALTARRWLHNRGLEADDLGAVAMRQRDYACDNPRALFREELTHDAYRTSPMVASPLRRLDCCRETDGAVALVLCRERDVPPAVTRPVFLRAAVRGGGGGGVYWDKADSLDHLFSHFIAGDLYRQAGMTPGDIDMAMLYDAYTFLVPAQLEDFGWCSHGDGLRFIAAGETARAGQLPVNTNGGMLSEGYVHGLNNTMEAVLQLRGECGVRQVQGVSNVLCSGFGGRYGAAAILSTD